MSEETSYQRDARVHCFLNGRFECECGEELPDEVLAEMILAVLTVEFHAAHETSELARKQIRTIAKQKIRPAAVDAVRHELA